MLSPLGALPVQKKDTVSEWYRRWTRNPLAFGRRGTNPLGVAVAINTTWALRRMANYSTQLQRKTAVLTPHSRGSED
jgi:hypothetical protein